MRRGRSLTGTPREIRVAAARRARRLRRAAFVAPLVAAGIAYGLHHITPLAGHGLGVTVLVGATAAAVAAVPALLARRVERQLPVVLTVRPDATDVRPVETDDLDFCTVLHAEKLPHGFFAALGYGFLRAYLATFVASPHAVALLVSAHHAPVGMVVGILRPAAHARWVLRRRGLRLALRGGIALAARPRLAFRFARTRIPRYRRAWDRRRASPPSGLTRQPAVLSHVAVAPGAEGAGLGSLLVRAFVDAARDEGCSSIVLATLAGEEGAAGFYRRLGWVESTSHRDFDGQSMIAFSLPLFEEKR